MPCASLLSQTAIASIATITSIPACLPVWLPTCLPAFMPAHLVTYLPTYHLCYSQKLNLMLHYVVLLLTNDGPQTCTLRTSDSNMNKEKDDHLNMFWFLIINQAESVFR